VVDVEEGEYKMKLFLVDGKHVDDSLYIDINFWSYLKFHVLGVLSIYGILIVGSFIVGLMVGSVNLP
jgi:hypothetical protein